MAEKSWHVVRDGRIIGPFTHRQLTVGLAAGEFTGDSLVWTEGQLGWTAVRAHAELKHLLGAPSPRAGERAPVAGTGTYVGRHWRGELSLPVSYWINCALLTTLLTLATMVGSSLISSAASSRLVAGLVVAFWVAVLAISIWQVVGTWRATTSHVRRGRSRGWAIAAKVLMVLATIRVVFTYTTQAIPQSTEMAQIALGRDPLGSYEVRVIGPTQVEISGVMVDGVGPALDRVLDLHPEVTLLHLDSEGGRVGDARRLAAVIEARRLDTYVASRCYSSCTLAFAAGKRRLMSRSANFGFHQYAMPGFDPALFEKEYRTDRAYLRRRGIGADLVERAYTTPADDLWRPSHEELLAANFATGYAASSEVLLSGVRSGELKQIDASLTRLPVFAALKEWEPQTYAEIAARFRESFSTNQVPSELLLAVRPMLTEIYIQRLPYASDEAIAAAMQVTSEQGRVLQKVDPGLCYAFLFPQHAPPQVLTTYLPAQLLTQEQDAMAAIVRSAAGRTRTLPSEAEVAPTLQAVLADVSARHGNDLMVLRRLGAPDVDKAKVCDVSLDLNEAILRRPQGEASALFRRLLSRGRG